jgi:hypothetical protein
MWYVFEVFRARRSSRSSFTFSLARSLELASPHSPCLPLPNPLSLARSLCLIPLTLSAGCSSSSIYCHQREKICMMVRTRGCIWLCVFNVVPPWCGTASWSRWLLPRGEYFKNSTVHGTPGSPPSGRSAERLQSTRAVEGCPPPGEQALELRA